MRSAILLSALLIPATAAAHANLVFPPARGVAIKDGPCGAPGSVRGTTVTTLAPGSVLTVQFSETIDHPGHYRLSFDTDGQDFTVPADFTTSTEGQTNVIKDLIPDIQGAPLPGAPRAYTYDITLPNVECNNCTLQLIQMMTETATYEAANDLYFSCADITLAAAAPDAGMQVGGGEDAGVDPGTGNPMAGTETGGCSTGRGAELPAGLALLGLVGLRRRRRR